MQKNDDVKYKQRSRARPAPRRRLPRDDIFYDPRRRPTRSRRPA